MVSDNRLLLQVVLYCGVLLYSEYQGQCGYKTPHVLSIEDLLCSIPILKTSIGSIFVVKERYLDRYFGLKCQTSGSELSYFVPLCGTEIVWGKFAINSFGSHMIKLNFEVENFSFKIEMNCEFQLKPRDNNQIYNKCHIKRQKC